MKKIKGFVKKQGCFDCANAICDECDAGHPNYQMPQVNTLNLNGYPRLLVSVLAVSSTGEKCMEFGLASPITSSVEAFDAAIEQLQRSRDTIRRSSYLDWHIQINIRPTT